LFSRLPICWYRISSLRYVHSLICKPEADQQDWKRRGPDGVVVHGWVYHLEDVGSAIQYGGSVADKQGTIRDLNISQGPPGHVPGKKVNGFF
jgi:hypothetical protein